ncbi:MAG: (deoxy)nucleoside triphosphate pyrophosphohydrolase [Nitrospinota bacterium]
MRARKHTSGAEERVHVVAAIVRRGGRILICQRPPGGPFGGLWEFPGGKVEPGEEPERCLRREVREELGLEVEVGPLLWQTEHAYLHLSVQLSFYECALRRGQARDLGVAAHRWARPGELLGFSFLPADAPLVRALAAEERA